MPASEPKWPFFQRLIEAKRCNNIAWGGRGHASFFAMTVTGWLLFLKNPDSAGKFFLAYGCANTSLDKLPFALAKNNNKNTLSPSQLLATNKAATRRSFGLWMCKRKLEQIPFCTCQSPNPISLSSSKLLATNKEAALQH